MLRQRVRARRKTLGGSAGGILVVFAALLLIWYGLMLILLAFKVDPGTVNSISGYRSAFDALAGLEAGDVDSQARAIAAGAGVLALLVFGWLAWRALPRPYLARHDLTVDPADGRELVVEARALERLAEVASGILDGVASSRARAGADRIEVEVSLSDSADLGRDLAAVQDSVVVALAQHELPNRRVDVTLTGFERPKRKELL